MVVFGCFLGVGFPSLRGSLVGVGILARVCMWEGMVKHCFCFSNVINGLLRAFVCLGMVGQEKGYVDNSVKEIEPQMIAFIFPLFS